MSINSQYDCILTTMPLMVRHDMPWLREYYVANLVYFASSFARLYSIFRVYLALEQVEYTK